MNEISYSSKNIDQLVILEFQQRVLHWFHSNGRSFPWRNKKEVYPLIIAEVLLQKTNAIKVVSVYDFLLAKYPIPELLAKEKEAHLSPIFSNIGLKNKAKTLLLIAEKLSSMMNTNITLDILLSIRGIGDYMARSVMIHSTGKRLPLLDPNFIRIYERVFGVYSIYRRPRTDRKFLEYTKAFIPENDVSNFVYGILDIGGNVCTLRKPICNICPLFTNVCNGFDL